MGPWLPVRLDRLGRKEETKAATAPVRLQGCARLIDEEELVRTSTADMLGDLGYDAIEAASAEQALRLVDDGATLDLVITDHLMPGMNGAELARCASGNIEAAVAA